MVDHVSPNQPDASPAAAPAGSSNDGTPRGRAWRGVIPRLEALILLLALLVTVGTKLIVVRRGSPRHFIAAVGDIVLIDLAVILAVYVLVVLCHLVRRRLTFRRLAILLSLAVALWSVADAAYMLNMRCQLRLELLMTLVHDAWYCWPIVWSRAKEAPWLTLAGGAVAGVALIWMFPKVLRPPPLPRDRRRELPRIAIALGVLAAAVGVQRLCQKYSDLGYAGVQWRLSTHVGLVRSILTSGWGDDAGPTRRIPRANERDVDRPAADVDLPNIVIVIMESVAYWTTSLADPDRSATPVLRGLADEGVEFTTTRAGITITNKSIFSALTGVWPAVHPKKVDLPDGPGGDLLSRHARQPGLRPVLVPRQPRGPEQASELRRRG